MHYYDYIIFTVYMLAVLAVGIFHFLRNKNTEDYYVGGRSIKASHIGLSIVATDVGGGFSIGLGGVGFLMGLSGSWLLFTGLAGAWLSAVFIIPKIKKLDTEKGFMTYPDFLRHRYNGKVALAAAIISGIGYLGFTGAQMLAGAKLASATILQTNPFGLSPITFALLIIAVITILYTVIGGLKAVIYTDTIQWIILLSGLIFVTIPFTLYKIGGFAALKEKLPAEFFSLTNITPITFINWMVTIIPIWLVGMTLYQRIYACKDVKQAKKAWYIAGFFEYPVMAFTGVFLGMCARVVFPQAESEMALPMLIRDILPVGITGIVIASYFSAIMSTADSCLMASSGNFVNDIIERYFLKNISAKTSIRLSMFATFLIGSLSVILAAQFATVLNAILYAYSFMVAGLFIPTLGAYFWKRASSFGALAAMIGGGTITLLLMTNVLTLPENVKALGLDTSIYGIGFSLIIFITGSLAVPDSQKQSIIIPQAADIIEEIDGAIIQHGDLSQRVYLMKIKDAQPEEVVEQIENIAQENDYTKIFAKVAESNLEPFEENGFRKEAFVPNFYQGRENAYFVAKYFDDDRKIEDLDYEQVMKTTILKTAQAAGSNSDSQVDFDAKIRICKPDDAEQMAQIYQDVFPTYPFPIHDPDYLKETMDEHIKYFCAEQGGEIVALSSAEMDMQAKNAEMTDFATLPDKRGKGFASALLAKMENVMKKSGIKTLYTIARAISPGMNITFAKAGYSYGGRLVNNTHISSRIESMNVWYKNIDS